MVQQVAYGDGVAVRGEIGKDVRDGVFVVQFPVMDQKHDRHGGELLGAGREAEVGGVVDRSKRAEVSDAVTVPERGVIVLSDEDRESGSAGTCERREDGVEAGRIREGCGPSTQPPSDKSEPDSQGLTGGCC